MDELSVVAKTRVVEFQVAWRQGDDEAVEDAKEKLLTLGIDPADALGMRIELAEIDGDR